MPHIIRIINSSIILQKEEGMYVRFQIIPPESGCILSVKLVIFDVKQKLPVEGVEMEIEVRPKA